MMFRESNTPVSQEFAQTFSAIWYHLVKKDKIASVYTEVLDDIRQSANQLERAGQSPESISQEIVRRLSKECPELNVFIDPDYQDVYLEVKSVRTRIYFNWQARAK